METIKQIDQIEQNDQIDQIEQIYNKANEEDKNNFYKSYSYRNMTNNLFYHYEMTEEDIKKYCIISEIKHQITKSVQKSCNHRYFEPERLRYGSIKMKCSKCNYTHYI